MKPGRNDPCACGSGQKFKKCCGRVIGIAALASMPAGPALSTVQGTGRTCGTCTACCDGWMVGTIRGHTMMPGVPCHFVRAGGCSIYDERPQSPCRSFACGWIVEGSPFPPEFKPDASGIIIVPIRWRDRPAYLLRSTTCDPAPAMLEWMQAFSRSTGRPFFYEQAGEKIGYGPPAFQEDMRVRALRGEPMW